LGLDEETLILCVKILSGIGYCRFKAGDQNEAERYYQQALSLVSDFDLGSYHMAGALNCIGVLLFNKQSEIGEAMILFHQSLQHYQSLESNDANQVRVATVLNNIGRVHFLRSEYEEALPIYHEALAIRRRYLGSLSVDVAATVYNIGQTNQQLKQYDYAMQCYMEFLETAKNVFGDLSLDVAAAYKAIAEVHQLTGDLNKAKDYLKLSLTAQQTALGGRISIEVATTLNKLGNILYELKDFKSAMQYYKQGLAIEREVLPSGHKHLVITMTNIAHICKQVGQHRKALAAYKQVYQMQVNGDRSADSVDVADTLSSIGLMEYHLRDYDASFESYQEALRIRRQHYGTDDHVVIASTLNSIGLVLFKQELFELSKKCFSESLRIRKQLLGNDHRDVAILWYNIATIHFETGEDEIAIQMYKEALRVEKMALGEDHPDVILTLQHLGQVHQQLGHFEKALGYYQEALTSERRRLSVSNADASTLGRILNLLGNIHLQLAHTQEMMDCYVEASRIYDSNNKEVKGGTLVIAGYNFYGLSKSNPLCAPVA
jgi:tetratricopeptide (TPR) repeat protein